MSRGRIRRGETIASSAATVFSFLTNLDRAPEWDPSVASVRSMTRGPLRTGSILRTTVREGDASEHMDDEVTDFDPPWRFGIRSVLGSLNAVTYSLVEEDERRTRLEVVMAYDLPEIPPDSGVDEAAIVQGITESLERSLRSLKTTIEREDGG